MNNSIYTLTSLNRSFTDFISLLETEDQYTITKSKYVNASTQTSIDDNNKNSG